MMPLRAEPTEDTILSLQIELSRIRPIVQAAIAVVENPSWSGVCDEDVALEQALRKAGLLKSEWTSG